MQQIDACTAHGYGCEHDFQHGEVAKGKLLHDDVEVSDSGAVKQEAKDDTEQKSSPEQAGAGDECGSDEIHGIRRWICCGKG